MSVGDYLSRLMVALPLVLLLAAAMLLLKRRGWHPGRAALAPELRLVASLGLGPGVRLMVVEHRGQSHMLAVSRAGVTVVPRAEGMQP